MCLIQSAEDITKTLAQMKILLCGDASEIA